MEDWLLGPEQREELLTQAEEMQRDYEESRRVVMDYAEEDLSLIHICTGEGAGTETGGTYLSGCKSKNV